MKIQIKIYGFKTGCPYCDKAKDLALSLDKEKVDVKIIYVEKGSFDLCELYKQNNAKSVPLIFVDNIFIGGFQQFEKYVNIL